MAGNADALRLLLILFLATPVGVAAYMFWLAWTRGDEPERDAITVQYEPPNNLTPAECGTLVENAVALRSVTETITDLSVKGYLTVEQRESTKSEGHHSDYVFHLAKPKTDWANLTSHEREVLSTIFVPTTPLFLLSQAMEQLENAEKAAGRGMLSSALSRVEVKAKQVSDQYQAISGASDAARDSVAISDLQGLFALHLTRIRDAIFDRLVAGGYYGNRPDRIRMIYRVWGVFVGLLMAFMGAVLASRMRIAPLALIIVGLFTGATILGFGSFLPARTSSGVHTLAKVLGFRDFLTRVEKDHIERLEKTPELFEKYLPYAMALGVENRWTQAFATIAATPPEWYRGKINDWFLPMHPTNDLHQMSGQGLGVSSSQGLDREARDKS